MSLLKVRDLSVIANNAGRDITLVDRVSFDLAEGEILGLVGESGSGKTMACRGLMRLLPSPNLRVQGGAVQLAGQDLLALDDAGMRAVRGGQIRSNFDETSEALFLTSGYAYSSAEEAEADQARLQAVGSSAQDLGPCGMGD